MIHAFSGCPSALHATATLLQHGNSKRQIQLEVPARRCPVTNIELLVARRFCGDLYDRNKSVDARGFEAIPPPVHARCTDLGAAVHQKRKFVMRDARRETGTSFPPLCIRIASVPLNLDDRSNSLLPPPARGIRLSTLRSEYKIEENKKRRN